MARRLDEDGERRFQEALLLTHGKRAEIPFAIQLVLDAGFKGMKPVTNPVLRNYLGAEIRRKLSGALTVPKYRDLARL